MIRRLQKNTHTTSLFRARLQKGSACRRRARDFVRLQGMSGPAFGKCKQRDVSDQRLHRALLVPHPEPRMTPSPPSPLISKERFPVSSPSEVATIPPNTPPVKPGSMPPGIGTGEWPVLASKSNHRIEGGQTKRWGIVLTIWLQQALDALLGNWAAQPTLVFASEVSSTRNHCGIPTVRAAKRACACNLSQPRPGA